MSKKVFIIHGYGGYPEKNWFPWLKESLEKQGIETTVPAMPNTENPQLSEWLPHLQSVIGEPDGDTYLVGHSLGCITALQYLNSLPNGKKIGGVVLVAGFAEPIHLTELNNFFTTPLHDEKIKNSAKAIVIINSDDDPHVPLWQGEKIRDRFSAELVVISGGQHLNEKAGYTELPIVLEKLEEFIK
jgi:predicted alpha/beta hydrolase family esterase